MALTPGTRLGPYEIKSPLGAGGMGEVYRAADSRLGRDVAIKVLPPHLSSSEEARARFEREARTVSSLNHPHICTLFDIGREAGIDFLVMELVEGETLADRLVAGPLPIADVLRLGRQVSDALDRAHRAGVIHRDLKPGNIMLARNGAKLMDFGLARQTAPGQPGSGTIPQGSLLTQSPTVAQPLTTQGTLLGTFQYMAPEQLEGKQDVDARSDIWALGCVLYEMATGQRAFEGQTQASLISSIMRDMPRPMAERQPLSPPALERLVHACLAKDPDDRIQSAHDVGLQLSWIAEGGSGVSAAVPLPARGGGSGRERLLWIGALAAMTVAAAWALLARPRANAVPDVSRRFRIVEPPGQIFKESTETAISPDGKLLAYVAGDSTGHDRIWIHPLDEFEPRVLPGTEEARYPFWSPDGRSLAFFAAGNLKRIGLTDRDAISLCPANSSRGGSWGSRGTIVFAPAANGPLYAIPEDGGVATQATRLDSAAGEIAHRLPCFLPDGRHFLYLSMPPHGSTYETWIGSLNGDQRGPVIKSTSVAWYAPPGYLVFARGRTLMAQPFDAGKLATSGTPAPFGTVALRISTLGEPVVTVSRDGVAAFTEGSEQEWRLEWRDRAGRLISRIPLAAQPLDYAVPSPDGRRAVVISSTGAEGNNLSIIDLDRGTESPLTRDAGYDIYPSWHAGGQRVLYTSNRDGAYKILSIGASGMNDEIVLHDSPVYVKENPTISADDRWLMFGQDNGRTGLDVMLVDLKGDRTARALIEGTADDYGPAITPNGRLVAYVSEETGRNEVYLAGVPDAGRRLRVSSQGGRSPAFIRAGHELLYASPDGTIWSVPIDPDDPGAEPGTPHRLFQLGVNDGGVVATEDGERFLVSVADQRPVGYHTIILNWTAAIRP